MVWKAIESAPKTGEQILVGFEGQFEWYYYVAPAWGADTGKGMSYALPTHWTEIFTPA